MAHGQAQGWLAWSNLGPGGGCGCCFFGAAGPGWAVATAGGLACLARGGGIHFYKESSSLLGSDGLKWGFWRGARGRGPAAPCSSWLR